MRLAEKWAQTLGDRPIAFIHKTRDPDKPNQAIANRVVGKVEGKLCVLIDDMIDTGGTIVKATEALLDEGAADVVIATTHGILSDPATERLSQCKASDAGPRTVNVESSGGSQRQRSPLPLAGEGSGEGP